MSYDLWVWKAPVPADEAAFFALLERFLGGEEAAFEASPDVLKFHAELLRRYPALEDLDEDKVDDSPWAQTPDPSDRLVHLAIAWEDAEKMVNAVAKLARSHRLVVTDSASGQIVRP